MLCFLLSTALLFVLAPSEAVLKVEQWLDPGSMPEELQTLVKQTLASPVILDNAEVKAAYSEGRLINNYKYTTVGDNIHLVLCELKVSQNRPDRSLSVMILENEVPQKHDPEENGPSAHDAPSNSATQEPAPSVEALGKGDVIESLIGYRQEQQLICLSFFKYNFVSHSTYIFGALSNRIQGPSVRVILELISKMRVDCDSALKFHQKSFEDVEYNEIACANSEQKAQILGKQVLVEKLKVAYLVEGPKQPLLFRTNEDASELVVVYQVVGQLKVKGGRQLVSQFFAVGYKKLKENGFHTLHTRAIHEDAFSHAQEEISVVLEELSPKLRLSKNQMTKQSKGVLSLSMSSSTIELNADQVKSVVMKELVEVKGNSVEESTVYLIGNLRPTDTSFPNMEDFDKVAFLVYGINDSEYFVAILKNFSNPTIRTLFAFSPTLHNSMTQAERFFSTNLLWATIDPDLNQYKGSVKTQVCAVISRGLAKLKLSGAISGLGSAVSSSAVNRRTSQGKKGEIENEYDGWTWDLMGTSEFRTNNKNADFRQKASILVLKFQKQGCVDLYAAILKTASPPAQSTIQKIRLTAGGGSSRKLREPEQNILKISISAFYRSDTTLYETSKIKFEDLFLNGTDELSVAVDIPPNIFTSDESIFSKVNEEMSLLPYPTLAVAPEQTTLAKLLLVSNAQNAEEGRPGSPTFIACKVVWDEPGTTTYVTVAIEFNDGNPNVRLVMAKHRESAEDCLYDAIQFGKHYLLWEETDKHDYQQGVEASIINDLLPKAEKEEKLAQGYLSRAFNKNKTFEEEASFTSSVDNIPVGEPAEGTVKWVLVWKSKYNRPNDEKVDVLVYKSTTVGHFALVILSENPTLAAFFRSFTLIRNIDIDDLKGQYYGGVNEYTMIWSHQPIEAKFTQTYLNNGVPTQTLNEARDKFLSETMKRNLPKEAKVELTQFALKGSKQNDQPNLLYLLYQIVWPSNFKQFFLIHLMQQNLTSPTRVWEIPKFFSTSNNAKDRGSFFDDSWA